VIEIGSRAKRLPAPQSILFDPLVEPHAPGTRPWLNLRSDEDRAARLAGGASNPRHLIDPLAESAGRPGALRVGGPPQRDALEVTLPTPTSPPDEKTAGHLRYRMNVLLFADLRYSDGQ
jgi:hypothetical protein